MNFSVSSLFAPSHSICISADNFGVDDEINRAVLRLVAMDRLQAVGCRVGAPAWRSWGRLLHRIDGNGTDVGLYLDLTDWPLLPHSRRSALNWVIASHLGQLDRRALRAEVRAQLDAFEESIGHAPAFIAGHRHVHQLPGVRSELLNEVERRYGAYRPWLKASRRPMGAASSSAGPGLQGTRRWVAERIGARSFASMARRRGYRSNLRLLGIDAFQGGRQSYLAVLGDCLRSARDGDLLVCQPGLDHRGGDQAVTSRAAQFDALSSVEFDELLSASDLSLWPMSRILDHYSDVA